MTPHRKVATLTELRDAVPGATLNGTADANVPLTHLTLDSRQAGPGSVFVAVPGERFDGHNFIPQVVAAGVGAVVIQADRASEYASLPVPCLIVPDCRKALAPLACRFYGDPTRSLYLAGVTGTNGKTTTTLMIDSIARAAGDRTGTIGTLGATIAGQELPGERTTPEAPDLQRLFAEMVTQGVQSAAMEVASHALVMGRTEGCAFDVGVFTNLTQDHLDFHGTMAAYRDAKGILFTKYADTAKAAGKSFIAVLNTDDEAGRFYAGGQKASRIITYAVNSAADITPQNVALRVDQITYTAKTPVGDIAVHLGFGGTFNVANSLAAIGYGVARGLSPDIIAAGLAHCPPVPGRFQPVLAGQEFAVLVDYAHTPDGLDNVLKSARPLTKGRLISVSGCGGDRDKTKRPKMGRIAKELSDITIATSDNPRTENPEAILDDLLAGMDGVNGATVYREVDRRKAIALAVSLAQPGDTIVIAGKGHEAYQIIGTQTFPFDDVKVAAEEIGRL